MNDCPVWVRGGSEDTEFSLTDSNVNEQGILTDLCLCLQRGSLEGTDVLLGFSFSESTLDGHGGILSRRFGGTTLELEPRPHEGNSVIRFL